MSTRIVPTSAPDAPASVLIIVISPSVALCGP
eukprot:CAMPEP_0172083576 /NCGR_PEP_ID=MMETSP1043-20130122/20511_1 /TAXON_ID=464988 /ORGANISM="Hemiselmis andersenii, Strain CCMP441" /LENGTH=31 /DNA_ID= /DNA_START= /DNA_END= /DNA_ORIENTATION=